MAETVETLYLEKKTSRAYIDPSRICSICGKYEHPDGDFYTTATWLCPECAERIKKLLYPEVQDDA